MNNRESRCVKRAEHRRGLPLSRSIPQRVTRGVFFRPSEAIVVRSRLEDSVTSIDQHSSDRTAAIIVTCSLPGHEYFSLSLFLSLSALARARACETSVAIVRKAISHPMSELPAPLSFFHSLILSLSLSLSISISISISASLVTLAVIYDRIAEARSLARSLAQIRSVHELLIGPAGKRMAVVERPRRR